MSKKEKEKPVSSSSKPRKAEALASIVEGVLGDIHGIYEGTNAPENTPAAVGLRRIANDSLLSRVGEPLKVLSPRKKISVMIIGNHSAGKSSFINWYIEENIQKTGVAIETRGFTFVSHGKKRETLKGEATLRYFEHLKEFDQFKGVIPNLFTEITTSRAKAISAVDLIDSPGLVDGNMQYPYDVKGAILWLADHVDLILIFFDPVGQALCKRTMEVVEALNNGPHLEKIHYFLSKADSVSEEKDRYRVLIQVTQNLATRIRNSHAFKLPTFYLPSEANVHCTVPNDIEDICQEIDKTIQATVQKWLKALETDCRAVSARIDQVLRDDDRTRERNSRSSTYGLLLNLLSLGGLLLVGLGAVAELWQHVPALRSGALVGLNGLVRRAAFPEGGLGDVHGAIGDGRLLGLGLASVLVGLVANKIVWRTKPALSKAERSKLAVYKEYVNTEVLPREKSLWDQFFRSLNPESD